MKLLKLLALLFVVANAGLWFGVDLLRPGGSAEWGSGRLPRVADLQVAAPADSSSARPPPAEEQPRSQVVSAKPVESGRHDVPPKPPEESLQAPEICLQVGLFESEEQAREAGASAERIPDAARVTEVSVPLPPFHWVLLPPVGSRAEAYERFQKVRARGIDAYLVMEGPQENAISLGLFESRRAAENVLSERQSQGLEAILATFPRNQIRYALFFEAAALEAKNQLPAVLESLKSEFESVVKSRCEGVATPQKNP